MNLVGGTTLECTGWIGTRLYPQSPSEGKTVRSTALKAMGLYNPQMRHANDAMRHVVRHHLNHIADGVVAKKYLEVCRK